MKNIIAKLLGLKTREQADNQETKARADVTEQRRVYYTRVLEELQRNGTLPPNCDLKMPKQSLVIKNQETEELLASDGKWQRLPSDGEKCVITYKPQ